MKKLILAAAFGIFVSGASFAQTTKPKVKKEQTQNQPDKKQKSPEEKAAKLTEGLSKKLTLTADQKTRIYAINLQRVQASEALKSKYQAAATPEKGKHQEMTSINTTWENQLKGILTPAQFTTYETTKKDVKENRAADGKVKGKGKKQQNG